MNLPQLPSDVWVRMVWALGIIAAGLVFYALLNRVILLRAQHNSAHTGQDTPLIPVTGVPAILYFTTPECQPCKTIQRPALARLQERLGDRIQVVEVDAAERPDLAVLYGVLSVPTTFIIDGEGKLRHVNHGATRTEKLAQQLETLL